MCNQFTFLKEKIIPTHFFFKKAKRWNRWLCHGYGISTCAVPRIERTCDWNLLSGIACGKITTYIAKQI